MCIPGTALSRYINFYTDFAFKKIFGTEANKDLLISFLNGLFNLEGCHLPGHRATRRQHAGTASHLRRVLQNQQGRALYCGDAEGATGQLQRQDPLLFHIRTKGAGCKRQPGTPVGLQTVACICGRHTELRDGQV